MFVLPEDDIRMIWEEVRPGKTLTVSAYDRTNDKLIATGTLASVDNLIDTTTGTLKLRANFPNADEALFPNQFVNARLVVRTLVNVDDRAGRRHPARRARAISSFWSSRTIRSRCRR